MNITTSQSSTKIVFIVVIAAIVAFIASAITPVSAQTNACQGNPHEQGEAYNGSEIVYLNGNNYSAKWWTQQTPPGSEWNDVGACTEPGSEPDPTPAPDPTELAPDPDPTDTGNTPSGNGYDGVRIFYFVEWGIYGRNFFVDDLAPYVEAGYVTDIQYAFIAVIEDGSCVFHSHVEDPEDNWATHDKPGRGDYPQKGTMRQLPALRDDNPGSRITFSLGGWTLSQHFSDVAKDPVKLDNMVSSCVAMMKQYRFDGIDIDWEYPGGGGEGGNSVDPNDGANFTTMLQKFREALDAEGTAPYGGPYLLTAALPAGEDKFRHLEMSNIGQLLDYGSVMTYDFNGAWQEMPAHMTGLYMNEDDPRYGSGDTGERYYVDHAIQTYINGGTTAEGQLVDGGFPREKLVLGLPFYGLSWSGVSNEEVSAGLPGLYTTADSGWGNMMDSMYDTSWWLGKPGQPTPLLDETGESSGGSWQRGVWDYDDIVNRLLDNGYTRYYDEQAVGVYAYNPDISGGTLISYDDPQTVETKSKYAADNCLGGVMVWEMTNNSENGSTDLHDAIMDGFASGNCDPTGTSEPTDTGTGEPSGTDVPLAVNISGREIDNRSLLPLLVAMIAITLMVSGALIGRVTIRQN